MGELDRTKLIPVTKLIAIESFIIEQPSNFLMVYQSGHGDVWCNGEIHISMTGDCFGLAPINLEGEKCVAEIMIHKCDCDHWKILNEKYKNTKEIKPHE